MNQKDPSLGKLTKYCSTLKEFKGSKISLLKNGHNRDVYLLQSLNKKYVARVQSENRDSGSSVEHEVLTLKFLKSKNILFIPEVVHYNKRLNISIETFISNKHIHFKDCNEETLSLFAHQLATLHKISAKDFSQFCKENTFAPPKTLSDLASLKLFGIQRFAKAKEACPNKTVLDWIEPKLQKNLDEILKNNNRKGSKHLLWGDIGNNILYRGKKLFFIDFEFSCIGNSSELAYIKIHSHPKPSIFPHLVKMYSLHSAIPLVNLFEEIRREEKIIRLNDVIWAAMKWGENKNTEEETKYKQLTFKRMKQFEKI